MFYLLKFWFHAKHWAGRRQTSFDILFYISKNDNVLEATTR